MNPGTALLIIDVQRGFFNKHTQHVPAAVQSLQHDYLTVYATRFVNPEPSPFRQFLDWHELGPRDPDTTLCFRPATHVRLYTKHGYEAATPQLLKELADQGITDVHLAGMDTDACILTTALTLFQNGIKPRVIEEACGSTAGPDLHNCAMSILRRNTGQPETTPTGTATRWDPSHPFPEQHQA